MAPVVAFVGTEFERLAQVLAKIMGLKVELRLKEAEILFEETLLAGFGLPKPLLLDIDIKPFLNWLEQANLAPEKLNTLTDFLFSELDFERNPIISQLYAQKLNLIYQLWLRFVLTYNLLEIPS